jgi:hypothetical protein
VHVLSDPLGCFMLDLAEGWIAQTEDGITTVQKPGGRGLIYVAAARHVNGRQENFGGGDFLSRFLESIGVDIPAEEMRISAGTGCRIYSVTRVAQGAYWKHWSVTDDETALLISYMCVAGQESEESDAVEAMVRSVRLYHSRGAS